jgi:hypothetical protein
MAPRSALAVMIGALIQQAFNKDSLSAAAPLWMRIVAIASAIAVVSIIGIIANNALKKFEAENTPR